MTLAYARLRLRSGIALLALCAQLAQPPAVAAEPAGASLEQRVKAAYLYKFGDYVEWPAGSFAAADSPVRIGVAGADGIARALEGAVAGRSLKGRPIEVRALGPADGLQGFHILYVGPGLTQGRQALLARTRGLALLVVTDGEGIAPQESVIRFVTVDGHVRFEISRHSAERRHLVLGSALLSVAQRVDGSRP